MSGQLSTTFEMASVSIESDQKVYRSRSLSGKRLARLGDYHRWRLVCSFNPLTRQELGQLQGFLVSQRGGYETFTITPKGYDSPMGNWGPAITVDTVIDDNNLTLAGFTNNDLDPVKAGDVITIAGDPKVYMIVSNATATATGTANVIIEPSLNIIPSGGEVVTHTGVVFTVELDDTRVSFKRRGLLYEGFTVDMVEALS